MGFLQLTRSIRASALWRENRHLVKARAGWLVALSLVGIASGIAEAGVLSLIAEISAAMVAGVAQVNAQFGFISIRASIAQSLLVAFLLATVRLAFQALGAWMPSRLAADVLRLMRLELFTAFSEATWDVQSHEREGHMQELMSNQTNQAAGVVLVAAGFVTAATMFTAMLAFAVALSVPVALLALAASSAMVMGLRPLGSWGGRAAADLSRASMDQAAGINESVRMAEEAHVFGADIAIRTRVNSLVNTVSNSFFRMQFALKINQTIYQGLVFLLIVAGLAGLYVSGDKHLATLGAVILILLRAGTYGQQIQGSIVGVKQAFPYLRRIREAIIRYQASAQEYGSLELDEIRSLSFGSVYFHYQESSNGLHGISFSVAGGDRVGVVGPSGAGKSTLVQLLLRLRAPDDGTYLVNGRPASSYTAETWHHRVSYLPQDPQLLHASIADNIRFFRPLSDLAVAQAAKAAHIFDHIMAMPEGFDTIISERGRAVSGGQRQRICLARALASDPDLIVLDEPTSALDMDSEAAVHESLLALPDHVILLVIAHRVSTLRICNKILVLENGSMDAFASPKELSEDNAFFRRITTLASLG